jgi:nucleotide-sensitive chloride channel 1A
MSVTGRGFQLEYPSITLHAISRTESGPSIYCQLDETPAGDQPDNGEDDSPMRELKIVPERVEAREFSLICTARLSRKLLCSLS